MLNRIFFISEFANSFDGQLPAADQVFYSMLVDLSSKASLEQAYEQITNRPGIPLGLTLLVNALPDAGAVRSVTSFLFLPDYPCIYYQPVLNLVGSDLELLHETATGFKKYFASQGIDGVMINELFWPDSTARTADQLVINDPHSAIACQKTIFGSSSFYNKNIFCHATSASDIQSVTLSIQQAENEFKEHSTRLFDLATEKIALEKSLALQNRKNVLTEREMNHQKQYVDILRSSHSTRELQDYYNNQYEVLPGWYKRLGHLVKVITGKRSFRSLFRNDAKKNSH